MPNRLVVNFIATLFMSEKYFIKVGLLLINTITHIWNEVIIIEQTDTVYGLCHCYVHVSVIKTLRLVESQKSFKLKKRCV